MLRYRVNRLKKVIMQYCSKILFFNKIFVKLQFSAYADLRLRTDLIITNNISIATTAATNQRMGDILFFSFQSTGRY